MRSRRYKTLAKWCLGVSAPVLVALGQGVTPASSSGQRSPVFEVASVKASPQDGFGASFRGGPGTTDPGRIRASGVTLMLLIARAYGRRPDDISGPAWLDENKYEVIATLPSGSTKEDYMMMLQGLLAERFHLVVHTEARQAAVYSLQLATNGPKLREAQADAAKPADTPAVAAPGELAVTPKMKAKMAALGQMDAAGNVHIQSPNGSMQELASVLSGSVGRPVIDETGLTGRYEIDLRWAAETKVTKDPITGATEYQEEPILTAELTATLRKLGLQLAGKSMKMDVLIVDRAEKIPTEN